MPYTKHEMNIYRRGYRAGARRIVIAWLGGKCEKCGNTGLYNLEIAHIKPIRKAWRDYTDWLNRDNLKLLCGECNQREENEGRIHE